MPSVRVERLFKGLPLGFDLFEQFVEGIGKLLYSLILELLCHLVVMDVYFLQSSQLSPGLRDSILDAVTDPPVIAEIQDGLKRHCIYGIGSNQFLGVEYVAVCGILCASARPQWSLHMSPGMLERLEARRAENALELLVDEPRVGNGRASFK